MPLVGDGGVTNDEYGNDLVQWLNLDGTYTRALVVELDGQLVVPCECFDGAGLGVPLMGVEFDGVAGREFGGAYVDIETLFAYFALGGRGTFEHQTTGLGSDGSLGCALFISQRDGHFIVSFGQFH